ncbi:MAG: hypothetical protein ABFS14_04060 [Gemmatimonadota bacterium]
MSESVVLRLIMPDRWLEQVEEMPLDGSVQDTKAHGLKALLLRDTDDPSDFFVEYAERRVRDESVSLRELGVQDREIFSIRAYDLGHYRRFDG